MKVLCAILIEEKSDKMNKRHSKILELLTEHKKMEVTKLSELLDVSQVTIRKDLVSLDDSDDINNRLAYHYDSKQRIAQKAVESIQNGETVMIESGSCCALVALEIAQTKKDVTLITNSAFIADYIRKIGTVKIILLGGEYQNGFTGNDYMRSEAVRDMAKQADKVIIVTDSVKFHQKGVVNLLRTEDVDCIYTDSDIPSEVEEYLLGKNIEVCKVNP